MKRRTDSFSLYTKSLCIYRSGSASCAFRSVPCLYLFRLCFNLLLFSIFFPITLPCVDAQIIGVGSIYDETSCHDDLLEADRNFNLNLNEDEFVSFLKLQSHNELKAISESRELANLPVDFIDLHQILLDESCNCVDCGSDCKETFNIDGAGNQQISSTQALFLHDVCSKTATTIDNFRENTTSPTFSPSKIPTAIPSLEPTPSPTNSPSGRPTLSAFTGFIDIQFKFALSYQQVITRSDEQYESIEDVLIESISQFTETIADMFNSNNNRRYRRKLMFSIAEDFPPTIDDVSFRECPDVELIESTCMEMIATTTIFVQDERREVSAMENAFREEILISISELETIAQFRDSNIGFVKEEFPAVPEPPNQSVSLKPGQLVGIGAAGFVVGFALIGGMFIQSRRKKNDKAVDELDLHDDIDGSHATTPQSSGIMDNHPNLPFKTSSKRIGVASRDEESMSPSEQSFNSSIDSSNAGSSGWSSGGVSSLNTASVDSLDNEKIFGQRGATLATIGLASGITNNMYGQNDPRYHPFSRYSRGSKSGMSDGDTLSTNSDNGLSGNIGVEGPVPNMPNVSRNDLDAAIQAGDWAAVGATAALLANAASDTNSLSTRSYSSRRSSSSSSRTNTNSVLSSVDASRAAELDHLVDTGDWEGVVLAASKFEAASQEGEGTSAKSLSSEDIHSFTNSYADRSSYGSKGSRSYGASANTPASRSRSGNSNSVTSPSVVSESWSRTQKRDEIRVEVEALVRRVVPDEIDNVDEMMLQFRGREEELLETLRTMQERSIAQRARAAVQKNAKREAKNKRLSQGKSGHCFRYLCGDSEKEQCQIGDIRGATCLDIGCSDSGTPNCTEYCKLLNYKMLLNNK